MAEHIMNSKNAVSITRQLIDQLPKPNQDLYYDMKSTYEMLKAGHGLKVTPNELAAIFKAAQAGEQLLPSEMTGMLNKAVGFGNASRERAATNARNAEIAAEAERNAPIYARNAEIANRYAPIEDLRLRAVGTLANVGNILNSMRGPAGYYGKTYGIPLATAGAGFIAGRNWPEEGAVERAENWTDDYLNNYDPTR